MRTDYSWRVTVRSVSLSLNDVDYTQCASTCGVKCRRFSQMSHSDCRQYLHAVIVELVQTDVTQ